MFKRNRLIKNKTSCEYRTYFLDKTFYSEFNINQLMSFFQTKLKDYYDSEEDDVLKDFYIPLLKKARKYYRLAGFFSSSVFKIIARGLATFIENNGKMYLIIGAVLSKSDILAINKGLLEPEKCIEEFMLKELMTMEEKIKDSNLQTLAFMIANNQLEIKVAVVLDEQGQPLEVNAARESGIFHLKIGIFEDFEGNLISFSGSINETATAWTNNIEEFKVFRSWEPSENKYLKRDVNKFETFWQGKTNKIKIINIPIAVKNYLIKIVDNNKEGVLHFPLSSTIKLRDYQIAAIEEWVKNDYKGIFEMATGVGKTYAAIGCIKNAIEKYDKLFVIISSPFTHLIDQWDENLIKFKLNSMKIFGEIKNWERELVSIQFNYNIGVNKNPIILTTHDTLSNEKFLNRIKIIKGNILFIGDEVHGLGSPERKNGLLDSFNLRLGLSATPFRWFDEEGTEIIMIKLFSHMI